MKHLVSIAVGAAVALAVLGAGWRLQDIGRPSGQQVQQLDPARIELIRTPGGFLQVSEMDKVEEFGWKTSWSCPVLDCGKLPHTISRVRVKARYVYGVPLAAEWRLEPRGDHYRLKVPPLQLQQGPVAFDTRGMEIATTEKSVFSPAAAPNREQALRHLGPELARRGSSAPYLEAQQRQAEQTIVEFARKWMLEQGRGQAADRPIRVVFDGPAPG
ncbi:hypothetical protein JI739_09610 [Ramlibacter sp. AW1]|uniref:DUF4230 domain-containing protein n=1 Tax=Ramlibacter aurantiacus TaxID=2801330 RepID=A0A936ZI13_9BURK|nr:hypothetical protein [Ramlibacter aurantiacus]MBL0420598.1 hypothetical protein [Ramlibacter aurantiacus]